MWPASWKGRLITNHGAEVAASPSSATLTAYECEQLYSSSVW
jgi:hypothetical protein